MCGIGGIIGGALRADERESAARRLQTALRHRGPDDQAIFHDSHATLIHNRLAILDPTEVGRQPMTRGPFTVTFNGEIYDFRQRREELIRTGERFTTDTDTEVVLALHARDGSACLGRLRGMFALAIWDERDRSCLLARDPFGIKPLYYAPLPSGGLVFASELRAILASGLIARAIDSRGLDGFLASGSVPEPLTIAAGVRCLEAGSWLRWCDGQVTTGRYLDVAGNWPEMSDERVDLRAALADSVQHHLVSDVPVGLLLSGGVDSGALLALMRESGQEDIATFSIGVEETSLDELGAARTVARHFGARHHRLLLTQELARHWIGDFLEALDQPTLDGFNTYCACQLASDHGYKVVLSGLGADELFGGYPSFPQVPRLLATGRWLAPMGARIASHALTLLHGSSRLARMSEFLGGPITLARAYDAFRGVFTRRESDLIRGLMFGFETAPAPQEMGKRESSHPAEAISRLELTRYLRNQLLRDADALSMAHGVELRVPLLDVPLLSVLRRMRVQDRFALNKQAFRDAVPELPRPRHDRRKRGFDLPFAAWLDGEWSDLTGDLPALRGVSLRPWYRQWALVVLTHWLRRHGFMPA